MAMVSPKVMLTLAAGVCGTIFIGYCIYFDKTRHRDPDFKRKLHQRRQAKKEAAAKKRKTNFPNLQDHEGVQRFFLEEIQNGEEFLAQGDFERGVEHIVNAVSVCGQPKDLLNLLQQTLPPRAFQLLLQKLPSSCIVKGESNATMQEEDVE